MATKYDAVLSVGKDYSEIFGLPKGSMTYMGDNTWKAVQAGKEMTAVSEKTTENAVAYVRGITVELLRKEK